jgi:hypothetical protein
VTAAPAVAAHELLASAAAAGIRLILEDGKVRMVAAQAPPAALVTALRRHKAEIVELLRVGDLAQATNDGSPPGLDQPCHGCVPPPDPDDSPRNGLPGPAGDAQGCDSGPTRRFCEPPGSAARPGGFPVPEDESPPDPATAPIGKCRVCGCITPLNARRTCWPCSPAEPLDTAPAEDPPVQEPEDHPPWTNDREWIRLWCMAGPTLADREPVLRAWLASAPPPPLPWRWAAVELARIARNHGIEVEVEQRKPLP